MLIKFETVEEILALSFAKRFPEDMDKSTSIMRFAQRPDITWLDKYLALNHYWLNSMDQDDPLTVEQAELFINSWTDEMIREFDWKFEEQPDIH